MPPDSSDNSFADDHLSSCSEDVEVLAATLDTGSHFERRPSEAEVVEQYNAMWGKGESLVCDTDYVQVDTSDMLIHDAVSMTEDEQAFCDLIERVRMYQAPNRYGARIPVRSKWQVDVFAQMLGDYHDKDIIDWLTYGWPINRSDGAPVCSQLLYNHAEAACWPIQLQEYIRKEKGHDALLGPFSRNPFPAATSGLSPLNIRPQRDEPDRLRIILDLSFPISSLVNDGIDMSTYLEEEFTLQYPTVDNLAARIAMLGDSCYLYKRDLSRYFHQLPVDPGDVPYLGFSWEGEYYFCKNFPMGICSACLVGQSVTSGISHIMKQLGYWTLNYIDDFPGAEAGHDRAQEAFETLSNILAVIGCQESQHKAIAPCQNMSFLGVGYDVPSMTLFITPDWLQEILELLHNWTHKAEASRKELQSLVGKLQFVAKCV